MREKEPDPPSSDRRTLTKTLLGAGFGASAASFVYPAVQFMIPPEIGEAPVNEVVAGKVSEFGPNVGRIFKFGSRPGIVVRTASGEWRAYSAVCTHLNCTVQYDSDERYIWCACHNARFDPDTGAVAGGPPPRGLDQFDVNIRGDDVVVTRRA